MLNRLPVEDHFGAPAGVVRPHIYHLKRGYVYDIRGSKRLTPGPVMKYLEEIRLRLKYERWFCGHLHFDRYYQEENIRVVYGDILKVG